jgi:hypothetical protein
MNVSNEFTATVVEVVCQLITTSQKTHNMNYEVNSTRRGPLPQIFLEETNGAPCTKYPVPSKHSTYGNITDRYG